jgi:hypothetical protein
MELFGVSVNNPPSAFDEEGRRRNTCVQLNFSNEEEPDGFLLYESIAVSGTRDRGVVKITTGEVEGKMLEEEEPQRISLTWPGNGIGYIKFTACRVVREVLIERGGGCAQEEGGLSHERSLWHHTHYHRARLGS